MLPEFQSNAGVLSGGAVSAPLTVTEILVNADGTERPPRRLRKSRYDHGGMPHHGQHRILLVGWTLHDPAWMRMHVGQDPQLVFPAILPERRVADCVEFDGSVLIGIGVQVVVADICADVNFVFLPGAEQEGAALAAAGASHTQLQD